MHTRLRDFESPHHTTIFLLLLIGHQRQVLPDTPPPCRLFILVSKVYDLPNDMVALIELDPK